jgi:alkylation response protein AidB-like acyl-CoA dehydrogenase
MDLQESLENLGYGRKIFAPEHDAYRRSLRQFFRTQIEPNVRQWEQDTFFPHSLYEKAGAAGLLGAAVPEEYGGAGGDLLHLAILFEEHGYSPAGAAMEAGLTSEVAGLSILDAGTEAQKRFWLPKLCTGEAITDLALTESHSGSDPRSMKTRARREGDGYVLNGAKMWISNGPILDMLMVVARMDEAKSFSTFLVDAKAPGVTVSKPIELMMRSAGGVAEIFFDEVRLPADAVLGGVEGRGLSAGLNNITVARLATGARMLAACELAFVLTVDFVKSRMAFGQRVADFQNTQFKLAQIKTEITVGRGFLDDLLARAMEGEALTTESAMAKLWLSELEGRVMDECVQLHGGAGFSNEYPISKMYAFARVHRIYLGTSEIQKVTIARTIF